MVVDSKVGSNTRYRGTEKLHQRKRMGNGGKFLDQVSILFDVDIMEI